MIEENVDMCEDCFNCQNSMCIKFGFVVDECTEADDCSEFMNNKEIL